MTLCLPPSHSAGVAGERQTTTAAASGGSGESTMIRLWFMFPLIWLGGGTLRVNLIQSEPHPEVLAACTVILILQFFSCYGRSLINAAGFRIKQISPVLKPCFPRWLAIQTSSLVMFMLTLYSTFLVASFWFKYLCSHLYLFIAVIVSRIVYVSYEKVSYVQHWNQPKSHSLCSYSQILIN